MLTIHECTRKTSCYHCDDTKCHHAGDLSADCPKYKCDNHNGDGYMDCEHCDFIHEYIKGVYGEDV